MLRRSRWAKIYLMSKRTWWTNTSCVPSSGVTKPHPLATLNHLHRPLFRPPPVKKLHCMAAILYTQTFQERAEKKPHTVKLSINFSTLLQIRKKVSLRSGYVLRGILHHLFHKVIDVWTGKISNYYFSSFSPFISHSFNLIYNMKLYY